MCFYWFQKRNRRICFVEYSIKRKFLCLGMLCFMNIFFQTKRFKILAIKLTVLAFLYQNPFTEDQPILNQPSQATFVPIAPSDNVENNSNNDHESDIEVS